MKRTRRFAFLDGIRGLAAGYVVLHHAYMNVAWQDNAGAVSPGIQSMTGWLAHGLIAVQVFIVLSGFCLMLAAMGDGGRLRGGIAGFAVRRARRILPCYYGALVLSLCIIAMVPGMSKPAGAAFDTAVPVTVAGVFGHVLLIHNFIPAWFTQIDPPMWSISIEWQIYFIFALVLFPIWRRFGTMAGLLAGVSLGYGIHWFTGGVADYSQPSYIGFFAMGMSAAAISLGTSEFAERARRLPWAAIATVLLMVSILTLRLGHSRFREGHLWMIFSHFLAMAAAALLVAQMKARPHGFNLRRLLEWRPVENLGHISYSLYLTHFPVLAALYSWVRRWPLTPDARMGVMMLAGVPLSLGVACLFYKFLERPFIAGFAAIKPGAKKDEILPAQLAAGSGTPG